MRDVLFCLCFVCFVETLDWRDKMYRCGESKVGKGD